MAKEKADLALILGGPVKPPEEDSTDLEADAQAAMADAMPDLAADPARLEAFWQAVRLYVEKVMGGGGGY